MSEQKNFLPGMVEGFDLKVGNAMRKSYGCREFEHLNAALDHQLGDLPEPQFIHRFPADEPTFLIWKEAGS